MRPGWFAISAAVAAGLVCGASRPAVAQPGCVTGFSPSTVIIPPAGLGIAQPNPIATLLTSSTTCEWRYDGWLAPFGLITGLTPPWMGGVGPSAGTGPTTILVSFVSPNLGASPREEIFVFGGQQLILRQPVNTCVFTFSATTPARIPANGGAGTFTVDTSGYWLHVPYVPRRGCDDYIGGDRKYVPGDRRFFGRTEHEHCCRDSQRVGVFEPDADNVRRGAEHSAERAAGRDRCAGRRFHLCCPPATDWSAARHAAGATTDHERRGPERNVDRDKL